MLLENVHIFPNCLGAIDGKHIRVTKFPSSGSMNLNYKCYFSIVLIAIADSDYKFTYVDIGTCGKDCDSSVFQETSFFKLLIRNESHIPPSGPLFTNDTENFPSVFVGDKAFSLSENLMRPPCGSLRKTKNIQLPSVSGTKIGRMRLWYFI